MRKDAGLMRCNERLGHHDAFVHAWGYMRASGNARILAELDQALDSAEREGYEVPAWMRVRQPQLDFSNVLVFTDDDSPF